MLPLVSIPTAFPDSRLVPPNRCDQTCVPVAEYFARKMSFNPALVSAPPPKSTAFRKYPVTTTLPLLSTATPLPRSSPVLPKLFDQTCAPADVYFATKMSLVPDTLVNAPPPKSTVPTNAPVTTMLPLLSTVISPLRSFPVSPNLFDHRCEPVAEY